MSSNSNDNWSQREIPIKPNHLHRFRVWVKQERCYAWGPDVVITAYDSNGQALQYWQFRGRRGTRDWYPLEGYFVPPENAVKASVELRALLLPETVPVWFDDVSLEPVGKWTAKTERKDPKAEREAKFRYLRSLSMEVATPHFEWAKKLQNPPKIFFAIDRIAQREIVELAQRFGFNWHTVFITSDPNPQFITGEYYDRLSHDDLRVAYRQALSEPCDVIVLSGSVWDALTELERKETISKIEQGTSFVYLGKPWKLQPDDMLTQVLGAKWLGKEVLAKPITNSPLLAAYPQSLPSIPLHTVELTDGKVLVEAQDEKGNRYPLLVTKTLGKGQVLFVTYRTEVEPMSELRGPGLTPMFWRWEIGDVHFAYHEYLLASVMKWLLFACQPERWRMQSVQVEVETISRRVGLLPDRRKIGGQGYRSAEIRHASRRALRATEMSSTAENVERSQVHSIQVEAKKAKAVLNFPPYSKPLQLRWVWRDKFSRTLHEGKQTVAPNQTQISVELPSLDKVLAGDLFFEAIFADGDAVLDWAVSSAKVDGVKLTLQIDKTVFEPKEPIVGVAEISGLDKTQNHRLRLQLFDCYGWEWERLELAVKGNRTKFSVPTQRLRATGAMLIAKIVNSSGKVVAEERKEIIVAAEESWDDWRQVMWTFFGRAGYRPYLWQVMAQKLREMGIDTWLFNIVGEEWRIAAKHDFKIYPIGIYGVWSTARGFNEYAMTGDKKWLIREPCLSSPDERKRIEQSVSNAVKTLSPYAPIAYCLADENNLTYYNAPFDFCFSPFCLERMRKWLQNRYGDLSRLNEAWGKQFRSWEEVLPDTFEEAMRSRKFVSWAEHREFMDSVFVDVWRQAREAARKVDTKAKISISGTPEPEAYGGYDWFELIKNLDALLPYLGVDVGEMQRSFSDIPRTPWSAGYGVKGEDLLFSVWRTVFNQCRGIAVFSLAAMLEPDLTLPKPAKDFVQFTRSLKKGLGKLLIHAQPLRPQVAIYHSMPSIRAAFALGLDEELKGTKSAFVTILQSLGIQFVFVDARQLERGWLNQNKVKALILPMALAMSDAEVEAVRKFVANGGKVIADVLPAIFDERLKPRETSPLDDLFVGEKVNLLKTSNPFDLTKPPEKMPKASEKASGLIAGKIFLASYMTEIQFRACPQVDELCRKREQWVEKAMSWAGVNPSVEANWEDGSEVRDCLWAEWELGDGAKIVGVLRQPKATPKGKLKVKFPKGFKVYSLWDGKASTEPQTSAFVKLWSLLPKEPKKISVKIVSGKLVLGSDAVLLIRQVNAPPLTVFRLEFRGLDGKELMGLSQNILAKKGAAQVTLHLPYNLPSGWSISIRDVLTSSEINLKPR
ncbi:MAG: beta-galactosidase [Armatimonadota bacterium]|nr:beta-galactosidase [Armatimonadota bacterium]